MKPQRRNRFNVRLVMPPQLRWLHTDGKSHSERQRSPAADSAANSKTTLCSQITFMYNHSRTTYIVRQHIPIYNSDQKCRLERQQ